LIKIALSALSVLSAVMFAACGDKDGGKTTLTVWVAAPLLHNYEQVLKTQPNNKQAQVSKEIFDMYAAEFPHINLQLRNNGWSSDLNQALTRAIAGNTAPDVTVGEIYVPAYIANKHFVALEMGAALENDIIEQTAAFGKGADGKWYAAPVCTGTFGLSINVDVLKDSQILNADESVRDADLIQKGIDPLNPLYWEDLLLICQKIRDYFVNVAGDSYKGGMLLNNTVTGGPWRALAYQRTAGGEISTDNVTMKMNTAENEKAFQMMRDLSKTAPDDSINSLNEDIIWNQYFFTNKAAYIVDGIDTIMRAPNIADAGKIVPAPLPTYKTDGKKSNVLVGSVYFSIVSKSGKSDYSREQEFIRFLMREEIQLKLMAADLRVPTRKSVLGGEEIKKLPTYTLAQPFLEPITNPEYQFYGGIPSFLKNPATIWNEYAYFLDDVFKTDTSVSSLLTTVQTKMTAAYNS